MIPRVGILGFAHGHVNAYCAQWRETGEVQVIAGWDHDASRAAAARDTHALELAHSSQALLARADVTAVVIAAETSRHAELVEQAAAAGKSIILQKPLALTLAEAERMVRAVNDAGVPFTLAWQMRVDPQNLRMKQLLQDGTLGRVRMVRRRDGLGTHTWPGFADTWHANPVLNRGMWADDAAHAIDFLYWLLGAPVSVTAEIDTLVNPRVPDDNGIAIFRYADGTFAEVASSFTCVAGENTTEIVGDGGVAIQNYGDAPSCNAPRSGGAVGLKWFVHGSTAWVESGVPSPANHGERIGGLARPLAAFLRGERPPIATVEEGRDVLRLTLASYRAAELGRRVMMAEREEPDPINGPVVAGFSLRTFPPRRDNRAG